MLVQGVTSAADRVAKEVDLDQVVAAAVGATQEAIYFFGYKDLQVSGASPAQILRQTDADGKTILGPIDPLDPIRASIEDLRDNVDDRIYYFGSKDLVTTDLDPVTNTAIQLSRIDGDGVAEVGVVLERDWRPTIIAGDAYAFDKNGARVRLTASADVVRCEVRNATAEFDRINGGWRILSHPDQASTGHRTTSYRRPSFSTVPASASLSAWATLARHCSRRRRFAQVGF